MVIRVYFRISQCFTLGFSVLGQGLGFRLRVFLGLGFQFIGFIEVLGFRDFGFLSYGFQHFLGLEFQALVLFFFLVFRLYHLGLYIVQSLEYFQIQGFFISFKGLKGKCFLEIFYGLRFRDSGFFLFMFNIYGFLGLRIQSLRFFVNINIFSNYFNIQDCLGFIVS